MKTIKTPSKQALKSFLQFTVTSLLIGLVPQAALADAPQAVVKDVTVSVTDAFIPGGFDSEADAYVIVNGLFPNGCYRWKSAKVTADDEFTHSIKSIASVSQGMCIMVLVPFTKEIRLGRLSSGKHTLKFVNGDGTFLQKTLNIE